MVALGRHKTCPYTTEILEEPILLFVAICLLNLMPVKLLASDLDGTLVADLNTIPPRTLAAVRAATEQGVYVVIATGREYRVTQKFVRMLGLTTPVICFQGALTYNPQTDETIAGEGLPLPLAHQLIDLARFYDLALNLYYDGKVYAEKVTAQSRTMFNQTGALLEQVADLKEATTSAPVKGMIIHPAAEAEAMTAQLRAELGDNVSVFRSLDYVIEVTSPNVSKGKALARLATYYHIPQSQVMAIGDQDNDVEMIAWAGLGVAMGNASPGAKAAADYIAPSVQAEGAAWAIERFILGEQ
ncbi:MAG: HAD family phosphatase [Anaerolineae bacterium]|nr:HAD family phosphatase [Anaerolineae bacterium]